MGHGILLGIGEVRERFQNMHRVVVCSGKLLPEEFEKLVQAEPLRQHIEIDEVPLGPPTCDGTDFMQAMSFGSATATFRKWESRPSNG
jgi:hypothetical protein